MKKVFFAFCIIAIVAACSSGDNNNETGGGGKAYDRKAILTNWADNIIIPAYESYSIKLSGLAAIANDFTLAPDAAKLADTRQAWLDAYVAYQYIAQYEFGLAENYYLKQSANTYPTNVEGIQANINSQTYDLTTQVQFSKQGFPAMDYLLNGKGSDAETVAFYTDNAKAKKYLNDIIARQKTIAEAVTNDWKGNYRNEFIANDGTSISSAVNRTTNNFIKNYEKDVRAAKVGIPAGLFSNGAVYPDKTEAYYKNNVNKLLLASAIQSEKDFFNGKSFNGTANGPSLKSALDAINAVRDGKNLSDIINTQFDAILTANNTLNDSYSQQITSDNSKMIALYESMQKNLVYFKVDMISALSITIDYVDGDGD